MQSQGLIRPQSDSVCISGEQWQRLEKPLGHGGGFYQIHIIPQCSSTALYHRVCAEGRPDLPQPSGHSWWQLSVQRSDGNKI